ncbi:MAG: deoxyribose-phosphate aldolase [Rhodospirillales bacterium]|nr:deoxyribose-phosphate aldolase [Rhodospirillales bacterium]
MNREDLRSLARRVIPVLDLTNLEDRCDEAGARALCEKARTRFGPVAAVCIWPRFVPLAKVALGGSDVRVATVANFPAGTPDPDAAAREVGEAIAAGADEVDVVYPFAAPDKGESLVRACRRAAGRRLLKVILETGALGEAAAIRRAAATAIDAGADFVKTSTGKREPGVTPEAARAICEALLEARARRRWAGLKVSGGIRSLADAAPYLALAETMLGPEFVGPATFRIGASKLLDSCLAALEAA